jgi:hypothetical protein
LVEDEFEQATIATARAVRAHGLSLRKIGEELSRLGFTTRKGGKWYPTQIRRLLIAPSQIAEVARGEVVAEQSTITIQPTLFGEVRS